MTVWMAAMRDVLLTVGIEVDKVTEREARALKLLHLKLPDVKHVAAAYRLNPGSFEKKLAVDLVAALAMVHDDKDRDDEAVHQWVTGLPRVAPRRQQQAPPGLPPVPPGMPPMPPGMALLMVPPSGPTGMMMVPPSGPTGPTGMPRMMMLPPSGPTRMGIAPAVPFDHDEEPFDHEEKADFVAQCNRQFTLDREKEESRRREKESRRRDDRRDRDRRDRDLKKKKESRGRDRHRADRRRDDDESSSDGSSYTPPALRHRRDRRDDSRDRHRRDDDHDRSDDSLTLRQELEREVDRLRKRHVMAGVKSHLDEWFAKAKPEVLDLFDSVPELRDFLDELLASSAVLGVDLQEGSVRGLCHVHRVKMTQAAELDQALNHVRREPTRVEHYAMPQPSRECLDKHHKVEPQPQPPPSGFVDVRGIEVKSRHVPSIHTGDAPTLSHRAHQFQLAHETPPYAMLAAKREAENAALGRPYNEQPVKKSNNVLFTWLFKVLDRLNDGLDHLTFGDFQKMTMGKLVLAFLGHENYHGDEDEKDHEDPLAWASPPEPPRGLNLRRPFAWGNVAIFKFGRSPNPMLKDSQYFHGNRFPEGVGSQDLDCRGKVVVAVSSDESPYPVLERALLAVGGAKAFLLLEIAQRKIVEKFDAADVDSPTVSSARTLCHLTVSMGAPRPPLTFAPSPLTLGGAVDHMPHLATREDDDSVGRSEFKPGTIVWLSSQRRASPYDYARPGVRHYTRLGDVEVMDVVDDHTAAMLPLDPVARASTGDVHWQKGDQRAVRTFDRLRAHVRPPEDFHRLLGAPPFFLVDVTWPLFGSARGRGPVPGLHGAAPSAAHLSGRRPVAGVLRGRRLQERLRDEGQVRDGGGRGPRDEAAVEGAQGGAPAVHGPRAARDVPCRGGAQEREGGADDEEKRHQGRLSAPRNAGVRVVRGRAAVQAPRAAPHLQVGPRGAGRHAVVAVAVPEGAGLRAGRAKGVVEKARPVQGQGAPRRRRHEERGPDAGPHGAVQRVGLGPHVPQTPRARQSGRRRRGAAPAGGGAQAPHAGEAAVRVHEHRAAPARHPGAWHAPARPEAGRHPARGALLLLAHWLRF